MEVYRIKGTSGFSLPSSAFDLITRANMRPFPPQRITKVFLLALALSQFCGSMQQKGTAQPCYPNGDDVAGTVDHRQTLIHEQLPHVFDIPLVSSAEHLPLWALEDPDRLQGPRQDHGRQGSGKDEAGCVGTHCVHQGGAAGDVASDTAEGLAWNNHIHRVCFVCSGDGKCSNSSTNIMQVVPLQRGFYLYCFISLHYHMMNKHSV